MENSNRISEIKALYKIVKLAVQKGFEFQNKRSENDYLGEIPTPSLLQTWLRENHKIIVQVRISLPDKYVVDVINNYNITHIGMGNMICFTNLKTYHNDFKGFKYNEALKYGIEKGLELVKK